MTWPEYLAGCCRVDGRLTRLTLEEADFVLALLLGDPGRWLSVTDIADQVWPDANKQAEYAFGIVRTYVLRLRRHHIGIETLQGWGYRIPAWARGRPERVKLAA